MKATSALGLTGLSLLVLQAMPEPARAQEGFSRPTSLPAWGRDAVGARDATVVASNPALLAFMPGVELRFMSQFLDEESKLPTQGHALALAFPLPFFNLGLGARYDRILPPEASAYNRYDLLTLGLGWRMSATSGLGVSYQHYYSEATQLHGLGAWSAGWTARPWNQVGIGVLGRAINSPTNAHFGRIDPAWDVALSFRPTGSDAIELGLVGGYVFPADQSEYFAPRATVNAKLPSVGRLRGELAVVERGERPEWIVALGLEGELNGPKHSESAQITSLIGSGLGNRTKYKPTQNLGVELALRSHRDSAGLDAPEFGVLIAIDETPSARKHVALLRRLWRIAEHEPAITSVAFELRAAPAQGTARTQELRDAIANLQAHGKKVVCHVDQAGSSALYACSQADRILVHPGGSIRFAGFTATQFYLRGLLDGLGVKADMVRIGEHKSAPEMFTEKGPSEVALADRVDLMNSVERQWLDGVARGRHLTPAVVKSKLARAPLMSTDAKHAGLVDDFAYSDEIGDRVGRLVGHRVSLEESVAPRAESTFGATRRIALVYVDGDMVDGESQTVPLLGMRLVGARTLVKTLRQLRADPKVAGVVLRVDSPGGSALAADTLWRELQLLANTKPVVCSMGSVAASGGYYIASATHRIFANPATTTGSIGVYSGKADVSELLRRIGIGTNTVRTSPHADANSPFRPYTEEERGALQREIGQLYDMFLTRVSIGRKLDKAAIDRVGQGRVFTGQQAFDSKLVDELGGLRQALAWVRKAAGLAADAPIVELPPPDASLLEQLLGLDGSHLSVPQGAAIPRQLRDVALALSPFLIYETERPLMRLEGLSSAP